MKNKTLIRFLESFVLLPVITTSMPVGNVPMNNMNVVPPQVVLLQQKNIEIGGFLAFNQVVDPKIEQIKAQGEAIDAYFKKYDMPLEGLGQKMAEEADKNDIDWRLLPAISARESTGGKQACKRVAHNFFGWGSCKIGFKSDQEAIEVLARNLGGNNPNTAHHYDGKTNREILQKYNPPSIVPRYADQVIKIMNEIGDVDLGVETVNS
ncbi:glucosaminidase domain-containing protein [Candidatus Nomurabacteria bacterium]|nr:glucosaminidase domain-containing protein [Candidatus Nomurabacteria bacterium]